MDDNEFTKELPAVISMAKTLNVKDEMSAKAVSELVNKWRSRKKAFIEWIEPHIKRANDLHKGLTQDRAKVVNGYDEAINLGASQVITWQDEQERIRREAEAKLQAELKAKEEEARLAEAVELEKAGENELAEAIISEPIKPPKITMPVFEKQIGTRETWYAEVNDKTQLIKAVANGEVPLMAIEPNMVFLNRQAIALKNEMRYPGVIAKSKKGLSGK